MPLDLFYFNCFSDRASSFLPRADLLPIPLAWLGLQLYTTILDLFVEVESHNFLPRLALNLRPPDLCLLNCWDYRHVSPCPAPEILFLNNNDYES
jgi:hypothetical protein